MVSEIELLLFTPRLGRGCKRHCQNIFQPHYKVEEVNLQLFPLRPGSL